MIIILDYKASHHGSHTISPIILTVIYNWEYYVFNPRPVHARFLVDKVALAQFFSNKLSSPVSIILLLLHAHSFIYQQHYIISETDRIINLLKPNDIYIYICRTAALTSRSYILNIYSTNIHTEYFKHAA